jgi:hypothetical protein
MHGDVRRVAPLAGDRHTARTSKERFARVPGNIKLLPAFIRT